jgi:hypothetical protein
VITIQVFANARGDHRLDIEDVLSAVKRAHARVGVVLKRNADQTGYWVLHDLFQVGLRLCRRIRCGQWVCLASRGCPVALAAEETSSEQLWP